jgi:hypothetical protein
LYQRVALRGYNLEWFIFLYIFTLIIACLGLTIIYVLQKAHESKNEFRLLEDKINEFKLLEDKLYQKSSESKIEQTEELKQNDFEEILERMKLRKKELNRSMSSTLIIVIIISIHQVLFGFYNFSTELTIRRKILDYENTKRIILPYISDHEDKTFESKFVLIKNQGDYFNLLNEMDDMILKYGSKVIWNKK